MCRRHCSRLNGDFPGRSRPRRPHYHLPHIPSKKTHRTSPKSATGTAPNRLQKPLPPSPLIADCRRSRPFQRLPPTPASPPCRPQQNPTGFSPIYRRFRRITAPSAAAASVHYSLLRRLKSRATTTDSLASTSAANPPPRPTRHRPKTRRSNPNRRRTLHRHPSLDRKVAAIQRRHCPTATKTPSSILRSTTLLSPFLDSLPFSTPSAEPTHAATFPSITRSLPDAVDNRHHHHSTPLPPYFLCVCLFCRKDHRRVAGERTREEGDRTT